MDKFIDVVPFTMNDELKLNLHTIKVTYILQFTAFDYAILNAGIGLP